MSDSTHALEAYTAANALYLLFDEIGLPTYAVGVSRSAAFDLLCEYGTVILDDAGHVERFIEV